LTAGVVRVVGVGNAWRQDDGAGLAVARRLQGELPPEVEVLEWEGEPLGLLDVFAEADAVVLVDAVSSGAPAGTVHRLDARSGPLPASLVRDSTHALGVAEAVELARALGRLPRRLTVYGIEGERFEAGEGLSAPVAAAVESVAGRVGAELGRAPGLR
jgi:hydrogenase maturation protease